VARGAVVGVLAASTLLGGARSSQAGLIDDLKRRAGLSWDASTDKREDARKARARASAVDTEAARAKARLSGVQKTLLSANTTYFNFWRQMKRTESQIVRERHRQHIVTERYNRRRILFGRRLAAMQRTGSMGYLQIFFGSSTLSDLTRRLYLFRAIVERDAQLQAELKADKLELARLNNSLEGQWNERARLRRAANAERLRVLSAAKDQQRELQRLVNSRNAMLAYAAGRENEIKQLDAEVASFNARARATAIAQAQEEERQEREDERRFQEAERAERETRSLRRRYRYASASSDDEQPRSTHRSSESASTRRRWSERSSGRSERAWNTRRSYGRRLAERLDDDEDEAPVRFYRSTRYERSYSRRNGRRYRSRRTRVRRTYARVRMAERVDRVRYVPSAGGALKPMSISEIVFKEAVVPVTSGGGASSGSSSGGSSTPPPPADDFPASEP
jgi:peptidoglycan hydrolase CwlO-like protein